MRFCAPCGRSSGRRTCWWSRPRWRPASWASPASWAPTVLAFVAFCAASSAVYLVNDCADREADRLHPRKRHRPIAAGELSVRVALVVAARAGGRRRSRLALRGDAGSWACWSWPTSPCRSLYTPLAQARAGDRHRRGHDGLPDARRGGGLAADMPISEWFLLVAGFGSLFIVAGKRYSELHALGERGRHPPLAGALHRDLSAVHLEHRPPPSRSLSLLPVGVRACATESGSPWHT